MKQPEVDLHRLRIGHTANSRSRTRSSWCLASVAPLCILLGACAGQPALTEGKDSNGNSIRADFDDAPETSGQITPSLSYGAEVEIKYELEKNFDLNRGERDDVATLQPKLELAFTFEPDEHFEAFVNLKTQRDFALQDEQGDGNSPTELEIDEAYVEFKEPIDNVTLRLGRQDIDDEREWYYDSKFDAVTVLLEFDRLEIDLSANREQIIDRDVLNADRNDRINNYFATAEYELIKEDDGYRWIDEVNAVAFAVVRDDRSEDGEDPVFLGLRSFGEMFGDLEYWADFAIVRGEDGSDKLRGYGFDVGGTYEFDFNYDTYLTFGYAFGSGDSSPDDSTDKAFRQTGLEDNQTKFGGVTKLKYYGELFDPELSNLSILTAGVGIKPTRTSSVDLVYHHYRLNELSDELRNASVEENLNGQSKDIGDELDLVLGWRGRSGLGVDLVFSYFFPGTAYEVRDGAFFTSAEISYEF